MNIVEAWNKQRMDYQMRYASFVRKYMKNPNDKNNQGHMLECSYVLIGVFGLTSEQVNEIERNDGFTNADLEEIRG